MIDWQERVTRAAARYEDGVARLPLETDERQRQLTRLGNVAWAAGLSLLMLGRHAEAAGWLELAAGRYRESWPDAPPESWGRPLGSMKARLLAGDSEGARADAEWTLAAGAADSDSPIGRYAAVLAHLVRNEDDPAQGVVTTLQSRDDFPRAVADSLAALAVGDATLYEEAVGALLTDFESRHDFLEDIPVADTVLVLQALAAARGITVPLRSPLLPSL